MAGRDVVNQLSTEIDGEVEGLRAKLLIAEGYIDKLKKQTEAAGSKATAAGQQWGTAARGIASAAENMARSGNIAGESVKQIISQGANMAFAFGSKGPIIGAIGISTLAAIQFFQQVSDEAREAKRTLEDLDEAARRRTRTRDPLSPAETTLANAERELAAARQTLRTLQQARADADRRVRASGVSASSGEDAASIKALESQIKRAIDEVTEKLVRQREALDQLADARATVAERGVSAADQEARQLGQLLQAGRATNAERARAKQLIAQIRQELEAEGTTLEQRVRLQQRLEDLTKSSARKVDPEQVQESVNAIGRAYDDLFDRAERGAISIGDFDRAVRDLQVRIEALKGTTAEQGVRFEELAAQTDRVRTGLVTLTTDRAEAEFRALRNALLPEELREFGETVAQLRRELEAKGLTKAQVDELVRLKAAADEAARAMRDTEAAIAGIAESRDTPMAKANALLEEREKLEQQITALGVQQQTGKLSQVEAAAKQFALQARILKIDEALAKLGEEHAETLGKADANAAGFAGTLANGLKFAAGIAASLGGANAELARALTSSAALVESFSSLSALVREFKGFDNALSKNPLGVLGSLGGLVAGAAGLASALGGLFSRSRPEDPEARRQREVLEENNRRLAELAQGIGDLVEVSSTGRAIGNVARLSLTREAPLGFQPGNPLAPGGGPFFIPIAELLDSLNQAGTSIGQLRDLAEDFGLTLSELPTVAELQQLQEAVRDWQFGAFTKDFVGQLAALRLEFQLFDVEAPAEQFERFVALLKDPERGAPAIAEALGVFDLTTSAGIAAAKAELQGLFTQLQSGTLDAETFAALIGNLTPEQFLDALGELDGLLDSLAPKVRTAVEVLANALDAIDVALEFGAITPAEALKQQIAAIKAAFGGLVDPVDFTNLELFRVSVRAVISALTADGELTEQEQALVDALRALLGAYEAAADATRDFFDLLNERADILGTSTEDQLTAALEEFRTKFGGDLLDGIADPFSAEGRAQLQQRLRDAYQRLAEDGISAEEQPLVSAIRQMLRLIGSVAQEQADALELLARKASEALRAVFADLDFELELDGITDPLERLTRTATQLSKADSRIAGVLSGIDLSTAEGRDRALTALRALGAGTTDQDLRASILAIVRAINAIPTEVAETGAAAAASAARSGGRAFGASAATVTEVTANKQLDYLGQIAANTRAMAGALLGPVPTIVPPAIPFGHASAAAMRATATESAVIINLNFHAPISTANPAEFQTTMQRTVYEAFKEALAIDLQVAQRLRGWGRVD